MLKILPSNRKVELFWITVQRAVPWPPKKIHIWQLSVNTSTQKPCNSVQLTTLQGGLTVNQIHTSWLADNLQKTMLGGHGEVCRTVTETLTNRNLVFTHAEIF